MDMHACHACQGMGGGVTVFQHSYDDGRITLRQCSLWPPICEPLERGLASGAWAGFGR
jgi:hypothetical protein